MIVSRTCGEIFAGDADRRQDEEPRGEIFAGDADRRQDEEPRPVEAFRDAPAYVLLGDPGAGKTTAFEVECKALGEQACLVSARDFLTFDPQDHPEWRGKTLFIDGLDEIRAGAFDSRTPFDAIRARLDALERPRFRLSCREADWLGTNDRNHLEAVSPDGKVTVLRLNPLTDSDIVQLLEAHPRVDDAAAFIAEANERGIGGLLDNPQTLDLLARAVAGGDWPESRKETFEMACARMVREHNDEHSAATASSSPPAPDQLLDTAGRLCAVQLIAGKAGYTLHGKQDSEDEYPTLDPCGGDHPDRLRLALATKLFKGVSANRFTPVHRHVAEFLGARYLAQVIGDQTAPLPARRVTTLITGADGGVVTELRGLSAWLAAYCQIARTDLIERDPIGVGLYGDIRGFSLDERRALLKSLERDGSRIYPWLGPPDSQEKSFQASVIAFGALAAPDMEPALKEALQDGNRGQGHQRFTDLILEILSRATPLPRLAELLLEIVRDDMRWPRVKESALRAFMHNCPHSQDKTNELKRLLTDIHTRKVTDSSDDRLLGMLLTALYPDEVTPREVWSYYFKQEEREPIGRLWLWKIVENALDEQVPALLDSLSQHLSELPPGLELHHLNPLALKLLARGLKAYGDQLDAARLYDWLGVGESEYGGNGDEGIRLWLEQHPEAQKAVIMEGLDRSPESDEFSFHVHNFLKRLYGANLPLDFGRWCLEQAVAEAQPRVAEYLFERAFYWTGSEDLSLDILREHAQKNEKLQAILERLLASRAQREEWELKHRESKRTFTEEQQQRKKEGLAYVRSNEAALRENRATPALLHQLAQFYFRTDSTSKGPAAVEEVLQGNQHLTQAVLQGFRGAVDRQDVPAFEEILSLQAQGRLHYLAWPFLAGLAEIERTAPEDAAQWDDNRICKALAFYYHMPLSGVQPAWYQQLLATRPELVADVLMQCDAAEFRRGQGHLLNFAHLNKIWEPDHTQVLRHASLPLLRAFPVRCKLAHVGTLANLLWAAVRYADRPAFLDLIERKLARTSMNTSQRTYWLAAGLLTSPTTYKDKLERFTQEQRQRILHLTDFLCRAPKHFLSNSLKSSQLEYLIRFVGRHVNPVDIVNTVGLRDCFYTSTEYASGLVKSLIQNLATSPDKAASYVLASLLADPTLSAWHEALDQVQDAQRVIRRDADYRHPTIEQVCQTLDGGTPANSGDLAALVTDRLHELAVQIRTGNTDDWRQYWNVDAHGRPAEPRPENPCRDALLSDLQQRLPQGVDAQPEGHYVNDKRADIRVSYGGFQVPVEVKKNAHRDVWRAMRDQLMAQYASAPETDGYGIYLVFWFGRQDTQPPPSGKRPADAEELKERLEATLSPAEARKISVCVIDVSRA